MPFISGVKQRNNKTLHKSPNLKRDVKNHKNNLKMWFSSTNNVSY